jgi:ABC-type transport system substrate-binding protein
MSRVTVRVIAGDGRAAAGRRRGGEPRGDGARRWLAGLACAVALSLAAAPVASPPAQAQAQARADPAKVLRVVFPVAETGFDPQATSDYYSANVERAIFDSLYQYDWLARPYRMVPNTAAALPQISADGRVWTIKVRPGIFFADDPAFKGVQRELTAHDYVYSWKRLLDPRMRAPFLWFLDGKLVGAEPVLAKAKQDGRLDYDAVIPGLRAIDRHTIRIELVEPDYVLLGYLSHAAMAAVAREVIEAHGDASGWAMANPVGTGPYRLKEWRRGQRIVLEANPGFRDVRFPDAGEPADAPMIARMKGKRLPQIGRVEVSIIEESNPHLLAFNAGEADYVNVPADLIGNVLDAGNALKPYYTKEGVRHARAAQPALAYTYFNMDDAVVGGYTPDKVALRRAMVMGFNTDELIRVWYQGQAIRATQPIPPVVAGHSEGFSARPPYDPELARKLLDRFGYRDRDGDGFRELPDGSPLVITMGSATAGRDRERDELWKKNMTAIGIRIDFLKQKWPDLLKMGRAGKLQMWPVGWITQYGEGDAFMQLLYSRNIGQSNYARYRRPEYDAIYAKTKRIPDGPQRDAMYRALAEDINAFNPWDLGVWRVENTLVRPWVDGYKKHVYREHAWLYLDVDPAAQKRAR